MPAKKKDAEAKADTAPHPEDERKPDSPAKIKKPARKYIVKKTIREFSADQCTDLAASLTYYAVLSVFPALLGLVSLLGVVGQAQATTDAMLSLVEGIAPGATAAVEPVIQNLVSTPAAGLALIIGLAGAIWSASGYVGAFGRAMNRIYDVEEGRPFWVLKPVMLAITLVLLLMVALAGVLLVVSGPVAQSIGDLVGLGSTAVLIWSIAKWPVLIFFVVLIIAILYFATPNVKQPKFKWMSLGALFAFVVLIIVSVGFFFYVSNFGSYNATYGAIGGVIVALLWLWLVNISLLFGAELDAEMERGRQLQAGFEAEETIQLPPRGTRQSKKQRQKEDEEIRQGRQLRHSRGHQELSDDERR